MNEDSNRALEGTLEELTRPLLKALSGLPPAVADATLDLLEPLLDPAEPPEGDTRRIDAGLKDDEIGYYAVRAGDLKLIEDAVKMVGALIALPSKWPVLVAALIATLFRYRRRRIWLTARQGIVLIALRDGGPLTIAQLVEAAPDSARLDTAAVGEILTALETVSRADGATVRLAQKDDAERWRSLDV